MCNSSSCSRLTPKKNLTRTAPYGSWPQEFWTKSRPGLIESSSLAPVTTRRGRPFCSHQSPQLSLATLDHAGFPASTHSIPSRLSLSLSLALGEDGSEIGARHARASILSLRVRAKHALSLPWEESGWGKTPLTTHRYELWAFSHVRVLLAKRREVARITGLSLDLISLSHHYSSSSSLSSGA